MKIELSLIFEKIVRIKSNYNLLIFQLHSQEFKVLDTSEDESRTVNKTSLQNKHEKHLCGLN